MMKRDQRREPRLTDDERSSDDDGRIVAGRAQWMEEGDPRIPLMAGQYRVVRYFASNDRLTTAVIRDAALRADVRPGLVGGWLRRESFKRAISKERAEPMGFGFHLRADFDGPRAVSEQARTRALSEASELGGSPQLPTSEGEVDDPE